VHKTGSSLEKALEKLQEYRSALINQRRNRQNRFTERDNRSELCCLTYEVLLNLEGKDERNNGYG
jgi:hypothetical protein